MTMNPMIAIAFLSVMAVGAADSMFVIHGNSVTFDHCTISFDADGICFEDGIVVIDDGNGDFTYSDTSSRKAEVRFLLQSDDIEDGTVAEIVLDDGNSKWRVSSQFEDGECILVFLDVRSGITYSLSGTVGTGGEGDLDLRILAHPSGSGRQAAWLS